MEWASRVWRQRYDAIHILSGKYFMYGTSSFDGKSVFAGGAPGLRFCLPHARVMIHQPHGGAQGSSE